jgi:hypothetical protein
MLRAAAGGPCKLVKEVSTHSLLERVSKLNKNVFVVGEEAVYMVIAGNMITYEKLSKLKKGEKQQTLHHNGRSFTGFVCAIGKLPEYAVINRVSKLIRAHATCNAEVSVIDHTGKVLCKVVKVGDVFIPFGVNGEARIRLPASLSLKVSDADRLYINGEDTLR